MRVRGHVLRKGILLLAAVVALYPVWFMLSTAYKTQHQYLQNPYAIPWPLSLGNFSGAVHGATFFLWFKNSAILTSGSVVLCTAAAALAAYAIARMQFRGRNILFALSTALMVVPPVVMLLPLF